MMLDALELTMLVLSLAWCALAGTIFIAFYRIDKERQELDRIRKKIDRAEEMIRRINVSLDAMKSGGTGSQPS